MIRFVCLNCKKEEKSEGTEEQVYFEILERYKLLSKHRPHVNVDARKEAGFSCAEIKKLGAKASKSIPDHFIESVITLLESSAR